jgi:hypothetical protein
MQWDVSHEYNENHSPYVGILCFLGYEYVWNWYMNTELKVDRDSYVQYPLSSIFPDRGNPSLKVVNNHGISHLLMGYPQLCTYIIIYIYTYVCM